MVYKKLFEIGIYKYLVIPSVRARLRQALTLGQQT
jgi:hypothetical protein